MLQCPLCDSFVEKFKSNSHIIPKWAYSEIKENGRMIIATPDGVKEGVQKDPKGEFTCENCEKNFAKDDTFSARFFRDRQFYSHTEDAIITARGELAKSEYHHAESRQPLIKFILSLTIRQHLFERSIGKEGFLGPIFNRLKLLYLSDNLPPNLIFIVKHEAILNLHSVPQRTRILGHSAVEMIFFGYRIFLITDKRRIQDKSFDAVWDDPNVLILAIGKELSDRYATDLAINLRELGYDFKKND